MLRRLHVARSRFTADEDAVLADAVSHVQTAADPLTPDERVVYDGDEYLGSTMTDGHLLTFCNTGRERVTAMGRALEGIGADRERMLLAQALHLWERHADVDFGAAEAAVRSAFDELDRQFFAAAGEPDGLEARTKAFVRQHLDSFVVLE